MQNKLNITNQSKVLFIYPHPDDETFSNAGLILKLVKQKIPTSVLCLTKGEASTLKFGLKKNIELSEAREIEFKNVMSYLKINEYKICDLTDGGLENQEQEVTKTLLEYVTKTKPTHIITFEPSGIYGHPDHIFVSRIVTEICHENNIELIYSTISPKFSFSQQSKEMAKNPSAIKPLTPTIKISLIITEVIKKIKALALYKTQVNFKTNMGHTFHQLSFMFNEYYVDMPSFYTKGYLTNYLKQKRVPVESWGEIRTVEHLVKEYKNNESYLTEDDEKVIRNINVVSLIIQQNNKFLLQYRQEFDSGASNDKIKFPSEKMIRGEEVSITCQRLLKEELNIEGKFEYKFVKEAQTIEPTPAYKGIYNKIKLYLYEVTLPSNLNFPENFMEEEQGKQKTYFKWFDNINDIKQ